MRFCWPAEYTSWKPRGKKKVGKVEKKRLRGEATMGTPELLSRGGARTQCTRLYRGPSAPPSLPRARAASPPSDFPCTNTAQSVEDDPTAWEPGVDLDIDWGSATRLRPRPRRRRCRSKPTDGVAWPGMARLACFRRHAFDGMLPAACFRRHAFGGILLPLQYSSF